MVRVIKYFNLPSFPSMPLSVTGLSTNLLIISHHLALWPWKGQLKSLDLSFSPGKEEGRHDWSLGSISPPNPMPWFCSVLTTWWPLQNKWERRKRLQQCPLPLFSLWLHYKLPNVPLVCKGWHRFLYLNEPTMIGKFVKFLFLTILQGFI